MPIAPNYPDYRPYTNIQPFTVRDGATYLLQLEALKDWLRDYVIPTLNTEAEGLAENWMELTTTLLADFSAKTEALRDEVDAAVAGIGDAVDLAQAAQSAAESARDLAAQFASDAEEIQDIAISTIAGNLSSATRGLLDSLYASVSDLGTLQAEVDDLPTIFASKDTQATVETGRLSVDTVNSRLDERKRVYRPEAYGAVGDGDADDSAAFTAMVDDMKVAGKVGGLIELAPGAHYRIVTPILMDTPTNVVIEGNGATFVRTTDGLLFGNRSAEGAKGYGAGGRNVEFRNFNIEGGYSVGVLSAFNHVSGLVFNNVKWIGAIRNTHAIDLAGCDNFKINFCEFRGNSGTDPSTAYSEAIQLDVSTYGASSLKESEPLSAYDGLPSIEGDVSWNLFTSARYSDVDYATPLPIGSHNFALTDGRGYYSGIKFTNNRVRGYVRHVPSGFSYGWIHLHAAKDVVIRENVFSYEGAPVGFADPQFVINNRPINLVVSEAEVASATPTPVISAVEYVAKNWIIENNQFNGFENIGTMNGNGIILFRSRGGGNDELMSAEENIQIRGNVALDVNGAVLRMFANDSDKPNKFIIEGNTFSSSATDNANMVVDINGSGIVRDNYFGKPPTRGIGLLAGVGEVKIIDNRVYGGNLGMRLDGLQQSQVTGNVVTDANSGIEVGTNTGASAADTIVTGNLVMDCPTRSIRLMGLSSRCVMYGNRAVNSPVASSGGTNNVLDSASNTSVTV